ncbi:MAG TPA: hypothetical protein VGA51_18965 [Casimicrobiaceae bacterium]
MISPEQNLYTGGKRRAAYHRRLPKVCKRAPPLAPLPRSNDAAAEYNVWQSEWILMDMEAEQVNQIANSLSGLQQRAADLRRYL